MQLKLKKLIFLQFLFSTAAICQNADWKELQGKIDSACKINGVVYIKRNYKIDRPLIAANWDGTSYRQVNFRIEGDGNIWGNGGNSIIQATFKNAPILSIQLGKGVVIKGVSFIGLYNPPEDQFETTFEKYGDPTCRDSRYSPYCAIAIDPFSGNIPPDGGYPSLKEWYRGQQTRSGSTGIQIYDVAIRNVTIGVITSPNGFTQNAEIISLENLRIGDCKSAIVGCQAQEKMNRIINLYAWGNCHTLFVYNKYGAAQPGNWVIDGVNVNGKIAHLINRESGGWGPMFMKNIIANGIKSIGIWVAGSGDTFSNSVIDLKHPAELGYFTEKTIDAQSLNFNNVLIRYPGLMNTPVLLLRAGKVTGGAFSVHPITNRFGWQETKGYRIIQPFLFNSGVVKNGRCILKMRAGESISKGDHIIFMQMSDWSFLGQGQVESINGDLVTVRYITPSVIKLSDFRIGVYKNG